jgi:hypothetical protein
MRQTSNPTASQSQAYFHRIPFALQSNELRAELRPKAVSFFCRGADLPLDKRMPISVRRPPLRSTGLSVLRRMVL